ncbi:MAG TPA: DUF2892 domain-containing protein [Gammaproteobacteria bacterium]
MKEVKVKIIQNLGWIDRSLRFAIGAVVMGFLVYLVYSQPSVPAWYHYAILIMVYPMLTAIFGLDPIYHIFSIRSCGMSERNPCGTFPFEVDAALGHHPIPDSDIEHSLERSHHEKRPKPAT